MIKTHRFLSTREAYDACQCGAAINDGDILIIAPEQVIGFASRWPFAITKNHGQFHVADGGRWGDILPTSDAYREAVAIATEFNWPLRVDVA